MDLLFAASILTSVAIGVIIGVVLHQRFSMIKQDSALAKQGADLQAEIATLNERLARTGQMETEILQLRAVHGTLTTQVATLEQQLQTERASADEKLQLLENARTVLTDQFKLTASEIMASNASRFAEQSQTNLGVILNPLRERLSEFQKKVEDVYVTEGKERASLKDQIQRLVDLNTQLSDDAKNLTSALRGSNKSQGNWGELILQRILEDAGLRAGVEFILQDAVTNEDGRRQQPDVVIQLPESRKIVVDAKVSLLSYERVMAADSDENRDGAVRDLLTSVRAHIKGLADRKYEQLYGESLDFVVMFIPIEPAFMLAVAKDERLCADAWDKNVLLVSPSTLLFVLRTVAYLWRQEAQTRNAKEIANRGAALYDKLAGFVTDLQAVGSKLQGAQQSYTDAFKKLSSGRGSVIRQAELLRDLGVKPNKALPKSVAQPDDDVEPAMLMAGVDGSEVQTPFADSAS